MKKNIKQKNVKKGSRTVKTDKKTSSRPLFLLVGTAIVIILALVHIQQLKSLSPGYQSHTLKAQR